MCATPLADRRQYVRRPTPTRVEFHHESSRQEYVGRCVDLSSGGLLMYVPAKAPLKVGDVLRLQTGVNGPGVAGLGEKPLTATIVRMDRHALLTLGHVAVGVRFHQGAYTSDHQTQTTDREQV